MTSHTRMGDPLWSPVPRASRRGMPETGSGPQTPTKSTTANRPYNLVDARMESIIVIPARATTRDRPCGMT